LDHYVISECGGRIHPDYAAAALADSRRDRADGVHVTTLLGCPRKSAIEATVSVYVNPLDYSAILSGKAWHALMETASNRPELCEVEVAGLINGVRVVGTVDRLHPPTVISDWKQTSEFAEKWLKQDGVKAEHVAQLSLYAELVEQSFSWRPTHGVVWYRTHKAMLPFTEALWPLDQVLDFHPLGGDWSVAELLNETAYISNWEKMTTAGETMKYGSKTACDYCSTREACWTQSKGAPF